MAVLKEAAGNQDNHRDDSLEARVRDLAALDLAPLGLTRAAPPPSLGQGFSDSPPLAQTLICKGTIAQGTRLQIQRAGLEGWFALRYSRVPKAGSGSCLGQPSLPETTLISLSLPEDGRGCQSVLPEPAVWNHKAPCSLWLRSQAPASLARALPPSPLPVAPARSLLLPPQAHVTPAQQGARLAPAVSSAH